MTDVLIKNSFRYLICYYSNYNRLNTCDYSIRKKFIILDFSYFFILDRELGPLICANELLKCVLTLELLGLHSISRFLSDL